MGSIINFSITIFTIITKGLCQDFGYDGNEGPTHWGEKYQHCFGKHQSPINIIEHQVQIVHLPPMVFSNFNFTTAEALMKNNGHTVVVAFDSEQKPMISGGPLIGDYEFAQLHFHWGANDEEGSENTINNSSYPLEIHIVFYQEAYGSFQEATEHPDGLAVLSFLYTGRKETNKYYETIVEVLPKVQEAQANTTIKDLPRLSNLIPNDLSVYYFYGGSLTTPPCTEAVTWIEFKNTIPLAYRQIEVFRQLNGEHGKLLHNFRPVQPLHGRTIRMNQKLGQNCSVTYRYLLLHEIFCISVIVQLLFK
ncbi:hypothetical protein RN001_005288 [Aquatica leii]|uniref:Carbonic anhydrase n=1 Tax=Aquatica leii TaxID=1421715 RepID=A0AAN7SIR4_9COLE|nr:hypothetical protein RN001_005288 [Aquatica leii]